MGYILGTTKEWVWVNLKMGYLVFKITTKIIGFRNSFTLALLFCEPIDQSTWID
jgi:hypothetical protein